MAARKRVEVVLQYLADAEALCLQSELLRDQIDDIQSAVWLEVAAWRELEAEVTALESRLTAYRAALEPPAAA